MESRESFSRRRRGRLFHVQGLKTEKAREPTVESLGGRNLEAERVSEAERTVREGDVELKTGSQR